ncbi:hypothetical protein BH23VER1_BH23VER1_31530 [soil metagenome]
MARRAHSGTNSTQIALILVAIIAVAAIAWLVAGRSANPLSGVTELDLQDYLNSANSLSGNVYKVEGTVDELLKWTPGDGRLFSVLVGTGRDRDPLPILIPPEFADRNVQQGQAFLFKVRVGKGGVLTAEDLIKI